jgi:predicted dienelactone hydrolase
LPAGPLIHDSRIAAFVIADPLSSVFPNKESFQAVIAPIQLWASERGGDGVLPDDVAAISRNLPVSPQFHAVPGSAHFAFLSVCPAAFSKMLPALRADAPGFDRTAFHKELNDRVVAFFREKLVAATQP